VSAKPDHWRENAASGPGAGSRLGGGGRKKTCPLSGSPAFPITGPLPGWAGNLPGSNETNSLKGDNMIARLYFAAALAGLVLAFVGCGSDPATVAPPATGNLSQQSSQAVVAYDYQELDVPAEMGSYTSAFGINNAGAITGNYLNVDGSIHGFLARKGSFVDDVFAGGGPTFQGALGGINHRGISLGYYSDADDVGHAYLRSPDGSHTSLPDAIPGAFDTDATGINNLGTIVGTVIDASGKTRGYIRRDGQTEIYDYPGAVRTRLGGVNDRGQVVGFFTGSDGRSHGFMLEVGTPTTFDFPGARSTRGTAINNRGVIVGFYNNDDFVFHGFIYQGGEFTTIDFPGSIDTAVFGINDQNLIVGTYDEFSRGFVAFPIKS
jgi:probable HAF family extracellular repeat protein